jgi:hypothetical protein
VFAGIRNDTTSYQALLRLHRNVGQLYVVDTRTSTRIFHPKLYLVRGIERARLVIGSANLTLAGLNNNNEAGMLLDFDLADAADKAVVDEIEGLFVASVTHYPDHVVKVRNIADLDDLLAAGRLIDERDAPCLEDVAPRDDTTSVGDLDRETDSESQRNAPQIKLKVKLLHSSIVRGHAVVNEPNIGKPPQVEPDSIDASSSASEAELESTATLFPVEYFRKKRKYRRNEEGPRLRASRLRMEAKRARKKWYFTGEPCIRGHIKDRLVSNGKCRECNRLACERSNRF